VGLHLRLTGLVTVHGDLALRATQGPRLLQGLFTQRIAAQRQLSNPSVVRAALPQLGPELDSRQLNLVIRYGTQRVHLLGAAAAKLVPELLDHQAALCCACVLGRRQIKPPVVLGLLQVYDVQSKRPVLHTLLIVLLQQNSTAHARPLQFGPSLVDAQVRLRHDTNSHLPVSHLHAFALGPKNESLTCLFDFM
jgi:hypothetical protein